MTYEFFISRRAELTLNGVVVGTYASVDAAADAAIRSAQDAKALYKIYYPL